MINNISIGKVGFLKPCLFFLGLIILIFVGWTAVILVFRTGDRRIVQAEENYWKGEAATVIAARQESFNSALALFLELDEEYHPDFGNGKLAYDIGNTYFQLNEYPLSILYYVRAERLMPRSQQIQRNLDLARQKIGLNEKKEKSLLDLILLKPVLSLPERLQLFFVLAFATLLMASAWLWEKKRWMKGAAGIFLCLAAIMLINLGVSYYFSPVEAVLIHAVELKRDDGAEFAKVGDRPIPGGTLLEVVGTSKDGKWLKVAVLDGEFGYVPDDALRTCSK